MNKKRITKDRKFKTCAICKETKPITEFNKRINIDGKNVGHSYCKTCKKIYDKNYEMTKRIFSKRKVENAF